MYLYIIKNLISNSVYVGITKTTIEKRFTAHKCSAKRGSKTKLYCAMRSYGIENFNIECVGQYSDWQHLSEAELLMMKYFKSTGVNLYNMKDDIQPHFYIDDKEKWRKKLCEGRKGKKPALNMKHSVENKKLFSEVSMEYWKDNSVFTKNVNEIIKYSFKEAKLKFGISKTHYYRLHRNQVKINELYLTKL